MCCVTGKDYRVAEILPPGQFYYSRLVYLTGAKDLLSRPWGEDRATWNTDLLAEIVNQTLPGNRSSALITDSQFNAGIIAEAEGLDVLRKRLNGKVRQIVVLSHHNHYSDTITQMVIPVSGRGATIYIIAYNFTMSFAGHDLNLELHDRPGFIQSWNTALRQLCGFQTDIPDAYMPMGVLRRGVVCTEFNEVLFVMKFNEPDEELQLFMEAYNLALSHEK